MIEPYSSFSDDLRPIIERCDEILKLRSVVMGYVGMCNLVGKQGIGDI